MNDTLIFIPTYNESENIAEIIKQINALSIRADMLFIDDASPDGTGQILESLKASYPNLSVQHRTGKLGIGTAHQAGIRWAYSRGYRNLITMDCDFTHSPEYIYDFLSQADSADVVVGSRYLMPGSLSTWNMSRLFLTRLGHLLTYLFLGMPYDATGSFRLYRLDRIPVSFLDKVSSSGYSFFFESLFIIKQNQFCIKEIPTNLPARTYGHSKMKIADAIHSLRGLIILFIGRIFNPKQFKIYS